MTTTHRMPRSEATIELHRTIIRGFSAAREWIDAGREGPPPRLAIAGEAGLGKTRATFNELASENWTGLRVFYALPSLALADELATEMGAAGIDARVVRGRSADDPMAPGEQMCRKSGIAHDLATRGYNVSTAICRKRDADGKVLQCPFFDQCGTQRQAAENKGRAGVLIGSHAYLWQRIELLNEDGIDLVIIDESFAAGAVSHPTADFHRFGANYVDASGRTRPGRALGPRGYDLKGRKADDEATKAAIAAENRARQARDQAEFDETCGKAFPVLNQAFTENRQVLVEDLRAAGLTGTACARAATFEYSNLGEVDIHPAMPLDVQTRLVEMALHREAFDFASAWKALGKALDRERAGEPDRFILKKNAITRDGKTVRDEIQVHRLTEPHFQKHPLIILDAHADEQLLARVYAGTEIVTIKAAWRNVRVLQCLDSTGSKTSFAKSENKRSDVLNLAREYSDGTDPQDGSTRPLIVTLKDNEERWIEGGEIHRWEDGRAFAEDGAFEVAHFGALRGRDHWKSCSSLIVAGRIEPSHFSLERDGRAWFGDEETPLDLSLAKEEATGRVSLPRQERVIRTVTGGEHPVSVSYHPDARVQRLLVGIREAELEQAVARARLVHREADRPCVVVLLTNVPLDLPVDEVAGWYSITPSSLRLAAMRGVMPDKSGELATAYPDLFPTPGAARQSRKRDRDRAALDLQRNCDGSLYDDFIDMSHSLSAAVGWTRVEYRLSGCRTISRASVRGDPWEGEDALEARVRAVLPGVTCFGVVGALPCPEAAPEASAALGAEIEAVARQAETVAESVWFMCEIPIKVRHRRLVPSGVGFFAGRRPLARPTQEVRPRL